jgi:hypothetical protein
MVDSSKLCAACLTDKPLEDYTNPLDVTWLCRTCHGARHREINEERRQRSAA